MGRNFTTTFVKLTFRQIFVAKPQENMTNYTVQLLPDGGWIVDRNPKVALDSYLYGTYISFESDCFSLNNGFRSYILSNAIRLMTFIVDRAMFVPSVCLCIYMTLQGSIRFGPILVHRNIFTKHISIPEMDNIDPPLLAQK